MPIEIPFDWREDENCVVFVLEAKGVKAKNVSVAICDVYVKVNVPPALFEVDLLHEIDPEHPKTRCRVSPNKVTLTLQKQDRRIWGEFRLAAPKAELRARREAALKVLQEREEERQKKKQEFKQEMLKQGEHAQWRLDSQNRETIEKWEKEEKDRWEEEVFRSFDEETGALLPESEPTIEDITEQDQSSEDRREAAAPTAPPPVAAKAKKSTKAAPEEEDLSEEEPPKEPEPIVKAEELQRWHEEEETEEYVPQVRDNPGKIGIRFTARPRPDVPVRDRGRKAPPFPKDAPKSEAPPMIAGDEEDESDPVWLKDKGDNLMTLGDYQGAYNAYTEALKLASNARCFANRAVAALYLGNFEQCLEDCNRSIQILDFRNKARPGEISHTADPEDEKVRARVEIRMGVAFLWLGAFQKAEAHFEKALGSEGLEMEEAKQVRLDLQRVQAAKKALQEKEQADQTLRNAHGEGQEVLEKALQQYDEADATSQQECAVVYANRCQAHLQMGKLQECLEDADAALRVLRRWPCAGKAPKPPPRPSGLEPPFLDDPTFVHPDQQNQGEREWLMKHNGGSVKDLPGLPDEYEWVKDSAEKNEDAWIAVKKRMSKVTIDAIKRTTAELQDALYLRNPSQIRQQIAVATEQNKAREGPSSKAIQQAEDYAQKLEEHEKAQEAQRDQEEAELRQEAEELDLEEALAQRRSGRGQAGFGPQHPLQRTRRRLFVKILLRRSAALDVLGKTEESLDDLNAVLQVEPSNVEAKQRVCAQQSRLEEKGEDSTRAKAILATHRP